MTALFRSLSLILLAVALVGSGCSKPESPTPSTKPAIAVETANAASAPLVEELAVTGTLTARHAAEVKSELAGLFREVYVDEWVPVRRGEPLARIQATESETQVKRAAAGVESARAATLQAQVEADRARRETERLHKLKGAGLATQQQLDDAESAAAAAVARVAAARAQQAAAEEELAQLRIRLDKCVLRSPIAGVVAQCYARVGDLSGADSGGRTIFRIVDNRLLDLTVSVPSSAMARVQPGQAIEFSSDGLPGQSFSGTVKRVNPSINPADRSLQVLAEVDNRDGRLKDGLFVKGRIRTGERSNVLLVSRAVLANLDLAAGRAVLFVVEGDKALRREVSTGTVSGEQVEIVAGLKSGERYVTRGGFNLRDGDRVAVAR